MKTPLGAELGLDGHRVVGYIGSFTLDDGLSDLLHAVCVVLDRGVELRVLVVGEGPDLPRLQELIVDLELDDEVVLAGPVPPEEVQRYCSLVDIVVLPRKVQSRPGMMSTTPFAAMAMEKAFLVSSDDELAKIVTDGVTGMVFTKNDIDQMADLLERMVNDPERCERLGRNARQWVMSHRHLEGAEVSAKGAGGMIEPRVQAPKLEPIPSIPEDVWKRLRGKNDRARQDAILRYPWTGRMLDIGTGRGFVACLIALLHEPRLLVGLEPDPKFLEQSHALAMKNGVNAFIAMAGSGENLPFPVASFDRILISEVLEHTHEPIRILREAARVLAPSGTMLVTVPRHGAMPPGTVAGHVQDFTVEEVARLTAEAGFQAIEQRQVALWEFHLLQHADQ